MSVEIHHVTVIVRRDALERLGPEGSAMALAVVRDAEAIFREDRHLLATDYMNPKDAEDALERLRESGPCPYLGEATDWSWNEVAVVDMLTGPTLPAPWLSCWPETFRPLEPEMGSGTYFVELPPAGSLDVVPRAWLRGFEEGPLAEVPFLAGEKRKHACTTTHVSRRS